MDAVLAQLSQELGYPSADKLYEAARRAGVQVDKSDVREFVKQQAVRQVFRQRPKHDGKIAAVNIDDRWAADLIDYTAKPSEAPGGPYVYVFICQDIFTRRLYTRSLKTKVPEVVQQAFEDIIREHGATPHRLDTDDGKEWRRQFGEYLVEEHIAHVVKDKRSLNALGTLDSAIRAFKQQLARIQTQEGTRNWASLVRRATVAYNDTVHSSLQGRAPDDVEGDADLRFSLERKAAQDLRTNTGLIRGREQRLNREGAFRVENMPKDFERAFEPKYGDELHQVARVANSTVYDAQGRAYPTRHVSAVPSRTGEVSTAGLGGGSAVYNRVRTQLIEPYKQAIAAYLGTQTLTIHNLAKYMKTLSATAFESRGLNYKKSLQLLGFTVTPDGRVTAHTRAPAVGEPGAPTRRLGAKVVLPQAPRRRLGFKQGG